MPVEGNRRVLNRSTTKSAEASDQTEQTKTLGKMPEKMSESSPSKQKAELIGLFNQIFGF